MNVLVTGPSCAGKSTLARSLSEDPIALDRHLDPREALREGGTNLYEGMVSGRDEWASAFLGRMDLVLLVEEALWRRLFRCVKRDGLGGLPRWLRNEWCWLRYARPLVAAHAHVRPARWELS